MGNKGVVYPHVQHTCVVAQQQREQQHEQQLNNPHNRLQHLSWNLSGSHVVCAADEVVYVWSLIG